MPADGDQTAATSDDSDDTSDDFALLHGALDWSVSNAAAAITTGSETISRSISLLAGTTLESQHILLRL